MAKDSKKFGIFCEVCKKTYKAQPGFAVEHPGECPGPPEEKQQKTKKKSKQKNFGPGSRRCERAGH